MKSDRKTTGFSCILLTLILICLGASTVGVLGVFLPMRTAKVFGPASMDLSVRQHFTLSAMLMIEANDLVRPADPNGQTQSFTVTLGESIQSITNRLEEQRLIPNADAFRNFLAYSGLDVTLQAGDYQLNPAMTPLQIARTLQDPTPAEVDFSILAGWRVEEIANALPTSGLEISPEAFLAAVSRPPEGYPFLQNLPSLASLEGYLFPGSYRLARKLSVDELVALLLANFEKNLDPALQSAFHSQGLTLHEAVILASMVEREAILADEMPVIASVFLNRLAAGMNLDSDPTVQYAIGHNANQGTWWTNPLSLEDLQVNSPYNTYLFPGLPPGPIANPGMAALKAVANPADTPYFYFRAACDGSGSHRFAQTYAEHVNNACP